MTAGTLTHDALLYADDDEFVGALEPFVRAGLAAGEPVVAVVPRHNIALLRDALSDAADDISYVDAAEWYVRPAMTIEGYARVLDELVAAGAPRVRVIGEVQFGDSAGAHVEWTRYEAALNHVFAGSPAWIVCPYDERVLPPGVVSDARRTHSRVAERTAWADSPYYLAPELLLRSLTPPAAPTGRCLLRMPVDADLARVRRSLAGVAASAGVGGTRLDDLVAAANEVLTNGVRHGRGHVELVVTASGRELVCEVIDQGPGLPDEVAGYVPIDPQDGREGGMGIWLARYLCDRLELARDSRGFVVRLVVADVFA